MIKVKVEVEAEVVEVELSKVAEQLNAFFYAILKL
jgi:hypothetical protein